MDVKKTSEYYESLQDNDVCQCGYCQNYVREIKAAYSKVSGYLSTMGVDIEKPFETDPLEPENGYLEYISVQYIVMGNRDGFQKTIIDEVNIDLAQSHPSAAIEEEHFVIEIFPIRLKWSE